MIFIYFYLVFELNRGGKSDTDHQNMYTIFEIYGEVVDCGESNKIKISGKMDKSYT